MTFFINRVYYKCKTRFTLCYDWSDDLKNVIKALRKERKITQDEFAAALGVTRQTIISLENGRYNASLVLAHKIAKFFGRNIEEVFIFEEE